MVHGTSAPGLGVGCSYCHFDQSRNVDHLFFRRDFFEFCLRSLLCIANTLTRGVAGSKLERFEHVAHLIYADEIFDPKPSMMRPRNNNMCRNSAWSPCQRSWEPICSLFFFCGHYLRLLVFVYLKQGEKCTGGNKCVIHPTHATEFWSCNFPLCTLRPPLIENS